MDTSSAVSRCGVRAIRTAARAGSALWTSDRAAAGDEYIVEPGPAVESLLGILAKAKLVNPQYGTRCSTILMRAGGRTRYAERSFAPDGADLETWRYEF